MIGPEIGVPATTATTTNSTDIKVVYIRTKEGSQEDGKIDEAVFTLAKRRIEAESLLPGYRVVIDTLPADNCTIRAVLAQIVKNIQLINDSHAIMGGGCDEVCDALLPLAEGTQSLVVGYLCETDSLRNYKVSEMFMTTAQVRCTIGKAYLSILNHFNWTGGKVAIVVGTDRHSYNLAKSIEQTLLKAGGNYTVIVIPYSVRKYGNSPRKNKRRGRFCAHRFLDFRDKAQCEYIHDSDLRRRHRLATFSTN